MTTTKPECPDGGTCHHHCGSGPCFRVSGCSPLSGVFPNDRWPAHVTAAHAARAPKGVWKWEHMLKLEPKGHRVFRDARDDFKAPERRGWAIADNSGGHPDTTEDGVLWLDFTRPIRVTIGEFAGATLPVRKERDLDHIGYTVMVGIDALLTIRKHFRSWPVELTEKAQTLIAAIELPAVSPPPEEHSLLDALIAATTGVELRSALAAYEATGDHNHGSGRIRPGGPCGYGDDCWVKRARESLAAIEALNHPTR